MGMFRTFRRRPLRGCRRFDRIGDDACSRPFITRGFRRSRFTRGSSMTQSQYQAAQACFKPSALADRGKAAKLVHIRPQQAVMLRACRALEKQQRDDLRSAAK